MSNNLLWKPSGLDTQLTHYINFLRENNLHEYSDYDSLHCWSINNKDVFWKSIWDFTNIVGEYVGPVTNNNSDFVDSKFFVNARLNYTKNVIKQKNNEDAIIFYSEQNHYRKISWNELSTQTNKFANYLKHQGIKRGDRIGAVLPNFPETVVAFLASAKIGAIWSSCSADFGPKAVIDRFKQISPKMLIATNFYYYNNKKINTLSNAYKIKKEIPSIEKIVVVPFEKLKISDVPDFHYDNWFSIMSDYKELLLEESFEFNIPLYILYSSGTTGSPKCIVHGAGGSLLQHKKEHQLHCNINQQTKILYFTTCGWMMWNWLVGCMASGSTICLYDGSPFYPKKNNLFKIIEKENISHFGTSAKYLDALKQEGLKIKDQCDLKNLKTILSTGSPLSPESFEYVYNNIKKEVHLASICGGTDIVSCFIGGNPNAPVYAGEIQCKGLGMDVGILDESGRLLKGKKGELVCLSPFISKPLYFWNDKKNRKYIRAYFSKYKNIWCQGDFVEQTPNMGFVVYGRSDATLNSGGIRIGTAELYNIVEKINNVYECVAVEQKVYNDTRVVLFVKLSGGIKLKDTFREKIKNEIKYSLSPKHVPSKIIQVSDIPRTKSGKIVELTIKKIINNEKVENLTSLINPESLDNFKNLKELRL